MMTTQELINGKVVNVQRLDDGQRYHAVNDFVLAQLGDNCSDEDFDDYVIGCEVLYQDDYDTGKSTYQIVDAQGHGDGTGEWYPVEDCEY